MKLRRETSGFIVGELVAALGDSAAQKILSVTDTRFKAFCASRACLSPDQLENITRLTGRAWERWAVDAGARRAKTAEDREFVAGAYAMWDQILGPEKTSPVRGSPRRNKPSALRQAI